MDIHAEAVQWINRLRLQPHPEGGYFREVYRAAETVSAAALPVRYDGPRCFGTSIYFLLAGQQYSALHRLASDEIWHFYAGCPLTLLRIRPDGHLVETRLGPDPANDEIFQAIIPAGDWFGARVSAPDSYTLIGCTVAPGFDFADFELGRRAALLGAFPQHRAVIESLTHPPRNDL